MNTSALSRPQRRRVPLFALIAATLLGLAATLLGSSPARAAGAWDNALVATSAEQYPDGYLFGFCKPFANKAVNMASGGTISLSGYQQGFANAGGVEVTSANAVKGDVIQVTPGGSTDATVESLYNQGYKALHTAIIVRNDGGGNFWVVDSNWGNDSKVQHHSFNPYTWAAGKTGGGIVKIWRLGKVTGAGANHRSSFNGDKYDDLIWFESNGQAKVMLSNGVNGFGSSVWISGWGAPVWAGVGDFNGDKRADVIWYESNSQAKVLISNGVNGFSPSVWINGWGAPTWADTGDFNGDGNSDVIWYEAGSSSAKVLISNGVNGFSPAVWINGFGAPKWAGVGDFNGDKKDDVIWYESNGQAKVLLSNGVNGFSPAVWINGFGAPKWAGVGDYNGDSKDDVMWYETGGTGTALISNGVNGFSPSVWIRGWGAPVWAASTR